MSARDQDDFAGTHDELSLCGRNENRCGPCRQFTPMLAEMYEHLKEERPTHGLEIVFVSSDRDANSFQSYFDSMPWQAIPFDSLQVYKAALSAT
jgi:hypothetical protein